MATWRRRVGMAGVSVAAVFAVQATAAFGQGCAAMTTGAAVYGVASGSKSALPYSATVTTTLDEKFADGNSIHKTATTHQARDSAGRTRNEMTGGCETGRDGQTEQIMRISVYDPATRTSLSWAVGGNSEKVVRVYHQPPPPPRVPTAKTAQRPPVPPPSRVTFRVEKLGIRTIAGVMADGARNVRVVPAGLDGNAQTMEFPDEIWIARDLQLAVLNISDDPTFGARTTTEVVELSQAEPDASLFAAPAGYTLEEQSMKILDGVGAQ
jgi:hypothetical protein